MRHQKGFTLLELMTTLAVGAILVSFAVPSMQAVNANSNQAGSINDLVSAIHIARSTAVSQNTRVTVCASDDGSSCTAGGWHTGYVVFRDVDGDQALDGEDTIIKTGDKLDSLKIAPTGIGAALTYRMNGRVNQAANGTVIGAFAFCDYRGSSHARALVIDISGRPRVLDSGEHAYSC